jgi:hypothetical protein
MYPRPLVPKTPARMGLAEICRLADHFYAVRQLLEFIEDFRCNLASSQPLHGQSTKNARQSSTSAESFSIMIL